MSRINARTRRLGILIGLLLISFSLYAAVDAGASLATAVLLGLLVLLMFIAIIVG